MSQVAVQPVKPQSFKRRSRAYTERTVFNMRGSFTEDQKIPKVKKQMTESLYVIYAVGQGILGNGVVFLPWITTPPVGKYVTS